ncbi:MAG: hypothetical protein E6J58_19265 [Deltaproteobacteria bacterium]|nr:MAG: hypothetical protein E6J58_19265 [Deltaproteobacteria bacterium]
MSVDEVGILHGGELRHEPHRQVDEVVDVRVGKLDMRVDRHRRAAEVDGDAAPVRAAILVRVDVGEGEPHRGGVEGDLRRQVAEREIHEAGALRRRPSFDGERLVWPARRGGELQDAAGGQRSEMPAEIVEREVLGMRRELHPFAEVGEEGALHLHVGAGAYLDGHALGDNLLRIRQHRSGELASGELEHLSRLRALLVRPVEHREVGELEAGLAREAERRQRSFRLHASGGAQQDPGVLQTELAQQLRELHVAKLKIGGERQRRICERHLDRPVHLTAPDGHLEPVESHPGRSEIESEMAVAGKELVQGHRLEPQVASQVRGAAAEGNRGVGGDAPLDGEGRTRQEPRGGALEIVDAHVRRCLDLRLAKVLELSLDEGRGFGADHVGAPQLDRARAAQIDHPRRPRGDEPHRAPRQLEGSAAGGDADRELRPLPSDGECRLGNGEVRPAGAHFHAGLAYLDPAKFEPVEEVGQALAARGWRRSGLIERELQPGVIDFQPLQPDLLQERPHLDLCEDAGHVELDPPAGISYPKPFDGQLSLLRLHRAARDVDPGGRRLLDGRHGVSAEIVGDEVGAQESHCGAGHDGGGESECDEDAA